MNLDIVKSATKELEDARLVVEAAEAKLRAVVNDKGPTVTLTPKGAAAVAKVGRRKVAGARGPKGRKAAPAATDGRVLVKRGPTLTPPAPADGEKMPKARKPRKPRPLSEKPGPAEESIKRVQDVLIGLAPGDSLSSDGIAERTGLRTPIVRDCIKALGAKVETIGKARATRYRWAGVSAGDA